MWESALALLQLARGGAPEHVIDKMAENKNTTTLTEAQFRARNCRHGADCRLIVTGVQTKGVFLGCSESIDQKWGPDKGPSLQDTVFPQMDATTFIYFVVHVGAATIQGKRLFLWAV